MLEFLLELYARHLLPVLVDSFHQLTILGHKHFKLISTVLAECLHDLRVAKTQFIHNVG